MTTLPKVPGNRLKGLMNTTKEALFLGQEQRLFYKECKHRAVPRAAID